MVQQHDSCEIPKAIHSKRRWKMGTLAVRSIDDCIGLYRLLQGPRLRRLALSLSFFFSFSLFLSTVANAQEGVATFGVQFRPLIPNEFVDFGPVTQEGEELIATWTPKVSLNFGMVVRYGFTQNFSIESGINLVRRNYNLSMEAVEEGVSGEIDFAFVGYEIPIQALYYVQLGEHLWMNASGGLSLDMYPSNTFSAGSLQQDSTFYDFEQFTSRNSWLQMAVQANYGFEWRTKDQGYFYLGVTYHQPFSNMAIGEAKFFWNEAILREFGELSGNYLTLDLRYFFHEDPDRRKR